jgi:tetratricopeptide (TPR) repeat protein
MKLSHILVFAGLGYLALNARRNVAIFVLATLPIAVEHASALVTRLREARDGKYAGKIAKVAGAGSVIVSLVIIFQMFSVVSGRHYAADRSPKRFGLGFKEQTFSNGAFVFVKEKGIRGPFFNNMDAGGMFIWKMYPDEKVFIDPRLEVNDADAFSEYRDAMSDPSAFRRLAKRYVFNAVVVSHTSQDGLGLIPILYGLPEWALVYLDPVAAVFVRDTWRNAQVIREHGIDLARDPVEPVVANDTLNDSGALALGKLFQKPLGADTMAQNHFNLGLVFFMTKRVDRAIEHFQAGLELAPDSVEGHYNLGLAYQLAGKSDSAAKHYESAIYLDSRHFRAHLNLGGIYETRGLKDKAEAEYRRAVKLGGADPAGLYNLGVFYYENGNPERARKYWQKALDANPSFGPAADALKDLDRRGL